MDNQPLPRVVKDDKGTVINCSLTIPETIFATFVAQKIIANLNEGVTLLFLGSKNLSGMQEKFTLYTTETFKNLKFPPEQLEIISIVTSLWQKSRIFIANELALFKNHEAVAEENNHLILLRKHEEELISNGYTGKMFTRRQGMFLIDSVNAIVNK